LPVESGGRGTSAALVLTNTDRYAIVLLVKMTGMAFVPAVVTPAFIASRGGSQRQFGS